MTEKRKQYLGWFCHLGINQWRENESRGGVEGWEDVLSQPPPPKSQASFFIYSVGSGRWSDSRKFVENLLSHSLSPKPHILPFLSTKLRKMLWLFVDHQTVNTKPDECLTSVYLPLNQKWNWKWQFQIGDLASYNLKKTIKHVCLHSAFLQRECRWSECRF